MREFMFIVEFEHIYSYLNFNVNIDLNYNNKIT